MNLKDFFNKYGTDTTSNFQLIKWAKELKIPNFHYVMRDEINELPLTSKNPLNVVTNIHASDQQGIHHSAFHLGKERYFFDSYGLNPCKDRKSVV